MFSFLSFFLSFFVNYIFLGGMILKNIVSEACKNSFSF